MGAAVLLFDNHLMADELGYPGMIVVEANWRSNPYGIVFRLRNKDRDASSGTMAFMTGVGLDEFFANHGYEEARFLWSDDMSFYGQIGIAIEHPALPNTERGARLHLIRQRCEGP